VERLPLNEVIWDPFAGCAGYIGVHQQHGGPWLSYSRYQVLGTVHTE